MPLGASRLSYLAYQEAAAPAGRDAVAVTAYGDAQIDTAQSKFGGASALFDGSGDYLKLIGDGLSDSDSDLTFEAWVRFDILPQNQTVGGGSYMLLATVTSNSYILFDYDSGRKIQVADSGTYMSFTDNGTWATDTWYHVAVVRESNQYDIYLDGVALTRPATSTKSGGLIGGASELTIGRFVDSRGSWDGYIDELRISSTARYTSGFTPHTTPHVNDEDTLLLLHMDGTDGSTVFDDDNGVRARVGVSALGDAQVDTSIVKVGTGSAVFDASGDYLTTSVPLIPASDDFTIEYWYYQQTLSAARAHFQQYAGAVNGRMGMFTKQTTGQLRFYILGTDSVDINSDTNIAADTWYHIAVVRNSGTTTMYLDGVSVGTSTGTESIYQDANFQIGVTGGASSAFGNIDEFRVSSTARYTTGFTPSTDLFVNDADTLLLLHMDGTDGSTDFIDDNA